MPRERLHVRFESPEALRSEFDKNISNRGLFIATDKPHQIQQPVTVEIELVYLKGSGGADCPGSVIELDGEIVHCVPVPMASAGVAPGVALELEDSVHSLRERFTPFLGKRAAQDTDSDREDDEQRGARRSPVRVPVRVMPAMSPPFEATSRNLSATGILLSMRDAGLPVDEIVRICLWHPSGDPSVVIDGKVVRQLRNNQGRIVAVAVSFDRDQALDMQARGVIDALCQLGQRRQLGGISGSFSDLGLANLLQMFGESAPQGTLVVKCDGEQGWIAFADRQLLGVEMGALMGHEALVALLDWTDGRFEFEASADAKLVESATRKPLTRSVLEALCAIEGRDREVNSDCEVADADEAIIGPLTTFEVQEELSVGTLDETEEALIDLARAGMTRTRMIQSIPEAEDVIQKALEGLVERGVLLPR